MNTTDAQTEQLNVEQSIANIEGRIGMWESIERIDVSVMSLRSWNFFFIKKLHVGRDARQDAVLFLHVAGLIPGQNQRFASTVRCDD